LGRAVFCALKNWGALVRYTEEGCLGPDNNFAEQCLGHKIAAMDGFDRQRSDGRHYVLLEHPLDLLATIFSPGKPPGLPVVKSVGNGLWSQGCGQTVRLVLGSLELWTSGKAVAR